MDSHPMLLQSLAIVYGFFLLSNVLEMLLGMLEFLLFHESTEDVKDVSLTDMRMESIEGYGNGGTLCDAFLLFRDYAECFFLLLL